MPSQTMYKQIYINLKIRKFKNKKENSFFLWKMQI